MKVVFWGTYDTGKPRTRILLRGLKENRVQVKQCHADVWSVIEDKSQVTGWSDRIRLIAKWFLSYPRLVFRYLGLPRHDAVVIGYMGLIDVLVLWPFARLRRVPIVWDAFFSLYDTVINDRKMAKKKSAISFTLYALEWLASRAAAVMFVDTRTHAEFIQRLFKLPDKSVKHVYVGAELDVFRSHKAVRNVGEQFTVLFYGQFISLHGIDIIVEAAKITESTEKDIRWVIIGSGQEQTNVETLIKELGVQCIHRIPWVRYEKLIDHISQADVCLGIFGTSGKAARVIPNKVYQILAAEKALVTGDTPAVRELLHESPTIRLVMPGSPEALASAVLDLFEALQKDEKMATYVSKEYVVGPRQVGNQLVAILGNCCRR